MRHRAAQFILAALLPAFALPLSASEPITHWTSTAAGCTVGPNGPGPMTLGGGVTYDTISTSRVGIQLICNVVPTGGSNTPEYASLSVGYSNVTAVGEIRAQVVEIDPNTGEVVSSSCVAENATAPRSGTATCALGRFTFDFAKSFYQVVITIKRASPAQSPQANGVRLN
jgi:hypothetical protein